MFSNERGDTYEESCCDLRKRYPLITVVEDGPNLRFRHNKWVNNAGNISIGEWVKVTLNCFKNEQVQNTVFILI